MKRLIVNYFLKVLAIVGVGLFACSTKSSAIGVYPEWDDSESSAGWTEIPIYENAVSSYTYLTDPTNIVSLGTKKVIVSTYIYPGGSRTSVSSPSMEDNYTRRRFDVPNIKISPTNAAGGSLGMSYTAYTVGRDTWANSDGAKGEWELTGKSLGLLVSVNNDPLTLQEISAGRVARVEDLSPEIPTIDRTTIKRYKKELSQIPNGSKAIIAAQKFVFQANIKGAAGENYKVEVTLKYIPTKNGQVKVSYEFKNIDTKTIPQFMIGYNLTPEVGYSQKNSNNVVQSTTAGKMKFLGHDLGVYTEDISKAYRAEFYPSLDGNGADAWTIWAQHFPGEYGFGMRDMNLFMKGFTSPTDLNSTGLENAGIPKDTIVSDNPSRSSTGKIMQGTSDNTDATISMKWNPKDLKVNETREATWYYASEIKSVNPRLILTSGSEKYVVPEAGTPSTTITGTWRSYETETATIKYSIDGGVTQNLPVSYKTTEDIGSVENFELPLDFTPTGNHQVTIYLEDPLARKTPIQTLNYSFQYPTPEFEITSSIKSGNETVNQIPIGNEFSYNMDLIMKKQYSRSYDNKVVIPIDTTIVNEASIKDVTISNGVETVNGVFDSVNKTLNFTLNDALAEKDKLHVQFSAEIIDSEELIGQTLEVIPTSVSGKSGLTTDYENYSIMQENLPKNSVQISPKISTININYLEENTETPLNSTEIKEGLTGTEDAVGAKDFVGYTLSKIIVDGVEQSDLTANVQVIYGDVNDVTFYYQHTPEIMADLSISKANIFEGEKVTFTSKVKNSKPAPSTLNNVTYSTTVPFPQNVDVDLTSIKLNGQILSEENILWNSERILTLKLGDLQPSMEYEITYDVVSKKATPPLKESITVNQGYKISGKSVNADIIEKASEKLETFVIDPMLASIIVEFVDEKEQYIPDIKSVEITENVGEKVNLKENAQVKAALEAISAKRYVLDKAPVDEEAVEIIKGGKTVKYTFKGTLSIASIPATIDFGLNKFKEKNVRVEAPTFDQPLTVWDNRSNLTNWTLTAKVTKVLTNATDQKAILPDAIRYNDGTDNETILGLDDAQPIVKEHHISSGLFDVNANVWKDNKGLKLDVKAIDIIKLGEYQGEITWEIAETP